VLEDDPVEDDLYQAASLLVEITMHCLVTIAYRIVPCDEHDYSPLKCNSGCINAARKALSAIVHGNETFGIHQPLGWVMFLNLYVTLSHNLDLWKIICFV
jgi:hypothetical protein